MSILRVNQIIPATVDQIVVQGNLDITGNINGIPSTAFSGISASTILITPQTITENINIEPNKNALIVGPQVAINSQITVGNNSRLYVFDPNSYIFTGNTSANCINNIWVQNLRGCNGTITIHDNLNVSNAISANTFYGDGSNLTGITGATGSSGTSGSSGANGLSGATGSSGTSGSSGANGLSGATGSSGTSGTSGTSGDNFTGNTSGTCIQNLWVNYLLGCNGTVNINGDLNVSGSLSATTFYGDGSNLIGISGATGTSGTSGSSGSSGTSGVGSSGTSGTSGTSGDDPYFVYTALISQNNMDNPTAYTLRNTIGSLSLVRISSGIYHITRSMAFAQSSTWFNILPSNFTGSEDSRFSMSWVDSSTIAIYSFQTVLTGPVDDLLNNTPIEIRVYK